MCALNRFCEDSFKILFRNFKSLSRLLSITRIYCSAKRSLYGLRNNMSRVNSPTLIYYSPELYSNKHLSRFHLKGEYMYKYIFAVEKTSPECISSGDPYGNGIHGRVNLK